MAQHSLGRLLSTASSTCRYGSSIITIARGITPPTLRTYNTISARRSDMQIQAAPEIDFEKMDEAPARILPASSSYFTASPVFNDDLLLLEQFVSRYSSIPTVPADHVPRGTWLNLMQYRSSIGEKVAAAKYSKVVKCLNRLNKIYPNLQPVEVQAIIKRFKRPSAALVREAKPKVIDQFGRAFGVGKRKESIARVYLVEGTGEVLINGKSIVQALPRLHDRESALWPLKISDRTDKYNVFALVKGGGITGQAESMTLALAKALLVHEPALKPILRSAGCITNDIRKVERKKPGRLKARKKPTWVKR